MRTCVIEKMKRKTAVPARAGTTTNKKAGLYKCPAVLLAACLAAVMGTYIFLNVFRYTAQMDSDIGAEALNARAIWEHQSIVPEEFYPSTETRILNVNLLGALFYGMTGNMNLSMGIACSMMLLLLAGLYGRLMKKLGFGFVPAAAGLLLLLVIPGAMCHAQILYLYAVYYAIHCILMLMTLMIWLNVIHEAKGWQWQALAAAVLAAVISLSGLRAALICYAPLAAVELVRLALFWIGKHRIFCKHRDCSAESRGAAGYGKKEGCEERQRAETAAHRRSFLYAMSLLAASFLGSRAPTAVGVGTTRNIRRGISKLLTTVLPDVWSCLYCENQSILRTILLILLLAAAAGNIVHVVRGAADKIESEEEEIAGSKFADNHMTNHNGRCRELIPGNNWNLNFACIVSFFWMSLLVAMVMGAFTTTASVWRYYFMIYFVISFSAAELLQRLSAGSVREPEVQNLVREESALCAESNDRAESHEAGRKFHLCGGLSAGLICLILIFAVLVWQQDFLPSLLHPAVNEEYDTIIAWMEEHNCRYGYSTYSSSNAMTVYSNGAVQVSAVADVGTLEICKWLTDRTWYVPYLTEDMETAYIIPKSRMEEFECQLSEHSDLQLQLETESYCVYAAPHNYTAAGQ